MLDKGFHLYYGGGDPYCEEMPMPLPQAPDGYGKISRWSAEHRAEVAQRRKLFRFLLETCWFDARHLQHEWTALSGESVNALQDAQRAGYKGRWWLKGWHQFGWRPEYATDPENPPPRPREWRQYPHPGVSLTDVARALGVSRERVRQHSTAPGFPSPTPSTVGLRRRKFFRADIERYYRECAEARAAFGAVRRRATPALRRNGRIKFTLDLRDPNEPGQPREFRIDIPNTTTAADLDTLTAEIRGRLLTPEEV